MVLEIPGEYKDYNFAIQCATLSGLSSHIDRGLYLSTFWYSLSASFRGKTLILQEYIDKVLSYTVQKNLSQVSVTLKIDFISCYYLYTINKQYLFFIAVNKFHRKTSFL